MKCEKCGKEHDGKYGSGRFCSKICAHSRNCSEEQKKRVSEKLKGVEPSNKGKKTSDEARKKLSLALKGIKRSEESIQKRKDFYRNMSDGDRKLYSEKVSIALKGKTGGYREGSTISKHGRYKGFWCDSSWELAYVIYNLEHNIPFKRNTDKFPYEYKGEQHTYLPDFILGDETYIEVKGYETEQNKARYVGCNNLLVLRRDDLKEIFEYVKERYGKDYLSLYEK